MTLAELKIECLRIIFANADEILYPENLFEYETSEQYGDYLANMTGAINRCFSTLENKRVLPVKAFTLSASSVVASRRIRVDTKQMASDFFDVDRIIGESEYMYKGNVNYWMEGDILVIENDNLDYTVLYYPSLPRIKSTTSGDMEIPVPDNIAAYIPYYVKGDIYREDEPNEAAEARNWFEQAISELEGKKEQYQGTVESIYSQTE